MNYSNFRIEPLHWIWELLKLLQQLIQISLMHNSANSCSDTCEANAKEHWLRLLSVYLYMQCTKWIQTFSVCAAMRNGRCNWLTERGLCPLTYAGPKDCPHTNRKRKCQCPRVSSLCLDCPQTMIVAIAWSDQIVKLLKFYASSEHALKQNQNMIRWGIVVRKKGSPQITKQKSCSDNPGSLKSNRSLALTKRAINTEKQRTAMSTLTGALFFSCFCLFGFFFTRDEI
jgi:hypothetical protein